MFSGGSQNASELVAFTRRGVARITPGIGKVVEKYYYFQSRLNLSSGGQGAVSCCHATFFPVWKADPGRCRRKASPNL
jgi:hypothetical protein